MIRINDKSLCSGCAACADACPVGCISMRRDEEGFEYPAVDESVCISCGKCIDTCPYHSSERFPRDCDTYAARSADDCVSSSSGGVFPIVAADFISKGGIVFGAVLNDDLMVVHEVAEDMAAVRRMISSKYVQSDLKTIFRQVGSYLEAGRKVLFTGTPCQVAGLLGFLAGPHENLLTIDFACHGVPSPGLWKRYVKALEKHYGEKIDNVVFRDKVSGWRHYSFTCITESGRRLSVPYMKDPYMALFAQNMTLRPSCQSCPFRDSGSGSDIRLSDLWSVEKAAPMFNDDKGVSGIEVFTDKGSRALANVSSGLVMSRVERGLAEADNSGFAGSFPLPRRREEFFRGISAAPDIVGYMESYVQTRPFRQTVWRKVRSVLSGIKRRVIK